MISVWDPVVVTSISFFSASMIPLTSVSVVFVRGLPLYCLVAEPVVRVTSTTVMVSVPALGVTLVKLAVLSLSSLSQP